MRTSKGSSRMFARSFERAGLHVIPAPTRYYSVSDARPDFLSYLPSAGALMTTHTAFYELAGLLWYAVRVE